MARAYYNEIDPYAAAWLRNLIAAGLIAPGDVDERSIEDVRPDDLRTYTQCHFFAGIGVWSYALRRAGWPDDRPVWTGSCPCQPFSAAGKGRGFADERHLWPAWFHLLRQRRPAAVFGEQVASKDGLAWLDLVSSDLEGEAYACGPVDFCAAGVGAPHIRQRLWWVAVPDDAQRWPDAAPRHLAHGADAGRPQGPGHAQGRGGAGRLGHPAGQPVERLPGGVPGAEGAGAGRSGHGPGGTSALGGLAHSSSSKGLAVGKRVRPIQQGAMGAQPGQAAFSGGHVGGAPNAPGIGRGEKRAHPGGGPFGNPAEGRPAGLSSSSSSKPPGPVNGFWRAADWLACRDGKWRPVEPGTFPLADGASARVGRLRAYGNAINAEAAAEVIAAYLEAEAIAEMLR